MRPGDPFNFQSMNLRTVKDYHNGLDVGELFLQALQSICCAYADKAISGKPLAFLMFLK